MSITASVVKPILIDVVVTLTGKVDVLTESNRISILFKPPSAFIPFGIRPLTPGSANTVLPM